MTAPAELPVRLNLGCGRSKRVDCLNVDRRAGVAPDLVWDLERFPYPLPAGHFVQIFALDVVEHLENLAGFMQEAYRLLAVGGILEITTPHFSCANSFTDPTHRRHLGYFSFDFFTPDSGYEFDTEARFGVLERTLVFHPGPVGRLAAAIANRRPAFYERRLTWILPAWFLSVRLQALPSRALKP
jgi:SAM-dependent methyltransferase